MEKYVIIGNGVAAASCIEGIRSVDKDGSITVVSLENHPVYCRPLISYYLENKTDTKKMLYRDEDFYVKNNSTVIYGKKAEKIDPEKKTVTLDDSTVIEYTKLCVATGSSPFVPPFDGIESVEKKFTFISLDDALALEKAVDKNSKVLIIGAGLIGLKCAEGLKDRVEKITVCDLADRVLSSILDFDSAQMVQKHIENNGVEFMLSDSVSRFESNKAIMQSEKEVEFDTLVIAIGVRPNIDLIKNINGDTNRAIIIDEHMKTSIDDIYCAGDCSEGNDITFDNKRVLALLPNANLQGFCAGVNMAGEEKVFEKAFPMNSIGFFGLHLMTAGTYYDEKSNGEVYIESSDDSIKKLYIKDGLLKGFILVNAVERAGIYTSLIRDKIPLDSINFDLLKKVPTSAAFSQNMRRKMFGGVV